jgi:FkbM family methyltransferase
MYGNKETRWGPCRYLLKDQYIGRSIHYYGEYGPDETEKILSLANGLCLDIGANIGCIGMALVSSGFSVISFEPQAELFKLLCLNVPSGDNRAVALGSVASVGKMPKVAYSERGNFGGIGIGSGTVSVPIVTLDSLELSPGFIKIDVEGFEREVLVGGRSTISRCKPVMYIEDDRVDRSSALRAEIRSLGYDIIEHKPTIFRSDNYAGYTGNAWDRVYCSHNLICLPK